MFHAVDPGEPRDIIPNTGETLRVVGGAIVRHRAHLGVGLGSAETLRVDGLPGCAFHQIRPAKPHEAGPLDHEDDVGERGKICATGHAAPHHRTDLGDPEVPPHD